MRETIRGSFLLISLLLVPLLSSADDPGRSAGAGMDGATGFERDLDARVDELLARRAALAEGRAMATLERREAERLDGLSRAIAVQARPRDPSPAHPVRRVAIADGFAVVRITAPARADASD